MKHIFIIVIKNKENKKEIYQNLAFWYIYKFISFGDKIIIITCMYIYMYLVYTK